MVLFFTQQKRESKHVIFAEQLACVTKYKLSLTPVHVQTDGTFNTRTVEIISVLVTPQMHNLQNKKESKK